MIVVYHNSKRVIKAVSSQGTSLALEPALGIAAQLMQVAWQFPDSKLLWSHIDFEEQINFEAIEDLLHHQKMMLSFRPDNATYFGSPIGYIEESPFININKEVHYPTWQMSSAVGAIEATTLLAFKNKIPEDADFDYFLCSIAKVGMPQGLLCYSDPQLLVDIREIQNPKANTFSLFRFVWQHYNWQKLVLLLFHMMIYEFRFPILAFFYSFVYKSRSKIKLSAIGKEVHSSRTVVNEGSIDIMIPTIGRKSYLYDFLLDVAQQSYLPKKLIIVEQNPLEGSSSELDYLVTQKWPFEIKHIFTHQAGACHARNLALAELQSEWVFMADDDIRIGNDFLKSFFAIAKKQGFEHYTLACYEPNYPAGKKVKNYMQWHTYGTCSSIVKTQTIKEVLFDPRFEFGYAEDTDYGMQIRNKGYDILFIPEPEILHLKAPIGGFRTKPSLAWSHELIQPKPSPTVMLYKQLYLTKEQIRGYKTLLFLKYYKIQNIKNPIHYFLNFRKQWQQSLFWANELKNRRP